MPERAQVSGELSLADAIRELSNQPIGDGRLARYRQRGIAFAERVTTRGHPFAPIAELAWDVNRRAQSAGASALAALIAYRFFVWLLPLALVSVFFINLVRTEPIDPERAIDRFGIAGYVGATISQATAKSGGSGLVTGLGLGLVVLLYQTYALLRGVRVAHALVWRVRLSRLAAPAVTTVAALALLVGIVLSRGVIDGVARQADGFLHVLVELSAYAITPAIWVLVSSVLPNGALHWRQFVPGALLFSVAVSVVHVLVVLVMFPYLEQKEATYGALGLAAGIMLALYALGWAVIQAAALNAELVARHDRDGAP